MLRSAQPSQFSTYPSQNIDTPVLAVLQSQPTPKQPAHPHTDWHRTWRLELESVGATWPLIVVPGVWHCTNAPSRHNYTPEHPGINLICSIGGHCVTRRWLLSGNIIIGAVTARVWKRFVITEKAPTRAFSWLNAPTSAFTFMTLLRHCPICGKDFIMMRQLSNHNQNIYVMILTIMAWILLYM